MKSPKTQKPQRAHRITHPIVGVATWREIQAAAVAAGKAAGHPVCGWCQQPVPKGRRTQCGSQECAKAIAGACSWGTMRSRALRRDGHKCALCGKGAWEVDHIKPVCEGGTGDLDNLRVLCTACHLRETRALSHRLAARRRIPNPNAAVASLQFAAGHPDPSDTPDPTEAQP